VLCLDWDRRALRMVVARNNGGKMSLEDAHSHRIPPNIDIDDPKAMGDFLAQMMRRHHWRHKRVIVDVPRERAVINTITLPPTPMEELAAAVRFQAIKELPFPVDDAAIDFAVVASEGKTTTEVLLAAVRMETLDKIRETCEAAGLTPARIGLRPYANVVSVQRSLNTPERRVLFVDVGPALTEIDIVRGGMLAFSRSANVSVPCAGGDVDYQDSRVSSKAELEQVAAVSDEAVEEAEKALVVEITRTLQAYRATEPNATIDQILIAGGTGVEPQLVSAVKQRFGLRTDLFDPTRVLGLPAEEGVKLRSFSAALGLAWGLSDQGQLEVDFLNPKRPIPRGQNLKQRLRLAGIAAGLALVSSAAYGVSEYRKLQVEYDSIQSDIRMLSDKLVNKGGGLLEVRNAVEDVREWADEGVFLEDLLEISQVAPAPGSNMRVVRTVFNRPMAHVSMKLLASDYQVPNTFVDAINQVGEGERYRARQRAWQPESATIKDDDPFKGSVDLTVDLLELEKHLEGRKAREMARMKRLKEY
jgi:type IV pilus assembly protein PilM